MKRMIVFLMALAVLLSACISISGPTAACYDNDYCSDAEKKLGGCNDCKVVVVDDSRSGIFLIVVDDNAAANAIIYAVDISTNIMAFYPNSVIKAYLTSDIESSSLYQDHIMITVPDDRNTSVRIEISNAASTSTLLHVSSIRGRLSVMVPDFKSTVTLRSDVAE